MIREEFWKLIRNASLLYETDPGSDNVETSPAFMLHHLSHSFNCLRQTIICQADMTVERKPGLPTLVKVAARIISTVMMWSTTARTRYPILPMTGDYEPRANVVAHSVPRFLL